MGFRLVEVVPSPSCPLSLSPQQYAVPFSVRPHEKFAPADIRTNVRAVSCSPGPVESLLQLSNMSPADANRTPRIERMAERDMASTPQGKNTFPLKLGSEE